MKEIVNFLLLMAIVIFAVVMIEIHSPANNGGPGAMTKSDAMIGVGLKISSEY